MTITKKSIKILWANAAGRCAFSDCRIRLSMDDSGAAAPHTLGQMAHIKGEKPGSNRHDPDQDRVERDDYVNLVLLCRNHHALIDCPENEAEYPVGRLHKIKAAHEAFVSGRLEAERFFDKYAVARKLFPLMEENHQAFIAYGPHSRIARRNPDSDAHGVWLSERLSTIIPNNRRMHTVIGNTINLFDPGEQAVLALFQLHVRGYDRWVMGEVSYEGVQRFPLEFETLMTGLANASP